MSCLCNKLQKPKKATRIQGKGFKEAALFFILKILFFMALKVKAVERLLKFTKNENDPGVYRYVMTPEL